jgi:hypothetical protein
MTGGAHGGEGGGGSNRRAFHARGAGGAGPSRGGGELGPRLGRVERGRAGPPSQPTKGKGGAADAARPRAWLGRAPGRAARGGGEKRKRKGFPF